jgi:hypothetical protein
LRFQMRKHGKAFHRDRREGKWRVDYTTGTRPLKQKEDPEIRGT